MDQPMLEPQSHLPRRNAKRTRSSILKAATEEFASNGLGGARIDRIADKAGVNKRMLYHYFGNKDDLYLAVLERTYSGIRRAEDALDLEHLPPREGICRLILFTFGYFQENPEFLSILNTENMLGAQHLRRSTRIRDLHLPLVSTLRKMIEQGNRDGHFRSDVDPVQLYISIAALGFFYFSNRHTLSTIFDRELNDQLALKERSEHIVEMILAYLQKKPE